VRVGIVGTGLIGASVGLASKAAGFLTTGFDPNPKHAAEARAIGAVDGLLGSAGEVLAQTDIVVIAAPLLATLGLLESFPAASPARLVMDVASVKVPVMSAAASLGNFVGGHPIAGSERSGPAAARADLFAGRPWALVSPRLDAPLELAQTFVSALGARPLPIDAERHDAVLAFTSHLPQLIATALGVGLARRLDDPAVPDLCGPGIRSMTRLAASAWDVWSGVLEANAAALTQEVRDFTEILRGVAEALESGDSQVLADQFAAASAAVSRI
jgi:prephenate dehydrogenase